MIPGSYNVLVYMYMTYEKEGIRKEKKWRISLMTKTDARDVIIASTYVLKRSSRSVEN
jgi:hypothetical protein